LITDGAAWISDYIVDKYPKATHILDFYHAVEHLHTFCQTVGLSEHWFSERCEQLKTKGIMEVLPILKKLKYTSLLHEEAHQKLLKYYQNNAWRMEYGIYLKRGLCIGNGAMEAANRTIVQTRCKRSGQIWSEKGVNHILNLRVALASGKWNYVTNLFKSAISVTQPVPI